MKDTITEEVCITLGDFAENFTFVVQDEIQSYHWSNPQVTLHPFVYYYLNDGEMCHRSLCVISDCLDHSTAAVHCFQKHLTEDIKKNAPLVKKIVYFSDGAGSQYKNKKHFLNICNHSKDFGLEAEWHFFATSHGKNACDGIGGTTKRAVSRCSLQRPYSDQITSAEEMFKLCSEEITGISYILVPLEEVETNKAKLSQRFKTCKKVPETRTYHKFVPQNPSVIQCYVHSKSETYSEHNVSVLPYFETGSFKINDILVCVYDQNWWIGEVTNVSMENGDLMIHFYHPHGPQTSFKISNTDRVWVPVTNVLRKLSPLEFTTMTGRGYNITEKLCQEISQLLNTVMTFGQLE